MMPPDDWFTQIHDHMLAGDPTAPAELAINVFQLLVDKLTANNSAIRDNALIHDACTEAWQNYVKSPQAFDPSKRGLFGFLTMSAQGDLINELAKIERRKEKRVEFCRTS